MAQVTSINDTQFEAEVLNSDRLTVVDFGATWCGPCKKLHPIMGELAEEYSSQAKILEVDVGISPQAAQSYAVISVPQVLFFRGGKVIDRIVGLVPKTKLKEKIDQHLKG
ncbi:MAG: thioredoxin [Candidatus Zixiibacteriota bacterium]|nr:MAG: thioredoxin [candidate division Zixibacteria bacterium]